MYYTVYKITNLINNKIYIGVHKTQDINDDYMGSGKYLKRAQEKYGIENFRKEIVKVFDNAEDMFNMESQLVNEDFVKDQGTYNLKVGGEGGWDYINNNVTRKVRYGPKVTEKARKVRAELFKDENWRNDFKKKCKIASEGVYKANFKGKKHSEESKIKMKESGKGKHKGEKNSQFGTMWIHSLTEKVSKKIKKDEFETYENEGWIKGRKMKF